MLFFLLLVAGISPLHNFAPSIEHFPYGLICALLFFRTRIEAIIAASSVILIFISTYAFIEITEKAASFYYIIGFINIISPLFFFRGNERLIGKVAFFVFWIYILVGILQHFSLLVSLENWLNILISRFSGGPIGGEGGYRGVQMLETEPARASFQLIALFIISAALYKKHILKSLLTLIFAQFFLISATTGIILTAILIMVKAIGLLKTKFYALPIAFLSIVAILPIALENPKIQTIANLLQKEGIQGIHTGLAATSGGRYLGSINAFIDSVIWPLGYGPRQEFFASGKKIINEGGPSPYVTKANDRPVSTPLTFIYVLGFPALVLLSIALITITKPKSVTSHMLASVIITLSYSPPFSAISLLMVMATFYESSVSTKRVALPSANKNDISCIEYAIP